MPACLLACLPAPRNRNQLLLRDSCSLFKYHAPWPPWVQNGIRRPRSRLVSRLSRSSCLGSRTLDWPHRSVPTSGEARDTPRPAAPPKVPGAGDLVTLVVLAERELDHGASNPIHPVSPFSRSGRHGSMGPRNGNAPGQFLDTSQRHVTVPPPSLVLLPNLYHP